MFARLSKEQRLCSVTDIETLVAHGHYCTSGHVRCCWIERSVSQDARQAGPLVRIMVSVPKKFFKRAVKRNLLKRRLREAYRLQQHILCTDAPLDMMFVYTSKEIDDFSQLYADIRHILTVVNGKLEAK